jgi:hypothetical protein
MKKPSTEALEAFFHKKLKMVSWPCGAVFSHAKMLKSGIIALHEKAWKAAVVDGHDILSAECCGTIYICVIR